MAETNLRQREKMKVSEKVLAYGVEAAALMSQGKLIGTTKRAELQSMFGESGRQIERYLHLSHLIPSLLRRLDNGDLTQGAGVIISQLDEKLQMLVDEYFTEIGFGNLDPKIAQRIKKGQGYIKDIKVLHQLVEDPIFMKKRAAETISFKKDLLREFISEIPNDEIVKMIVWLVSKQWHQYWNDEDGKLHYYFPDEQ